LGAKEGTQQVSVRSYSTRFELDEDPISEGGAWMNGRKDGIDWADVQTKDGKAYGNVTRMDVSERRVEQGNLETETPEIAVPEGDYDDPTALIGGRWGKNQHAKAKVFSRNPTAEYFQEVEIRLRSTITPHRCTGYEVFWRCLKTDEGYAEIVRWNGRIADFTSLKKLFGPQYGVKDGDLVEATVVGDVLKGFINGEEVISAIDDTYDSGSPGIGFNFGVGDTNVDHGFTYFEVDSYND
jgi:hypothetical protein